MAVAREDATIAVNGRCGDTREGTGNICGGAIVTNEHENTGVTCEGANETSASRSDNSATGPSLETEGM